MVKIDGRIVFTHDRQNKLSSQTISVNIWPRNDQQLGQSSVHTMWRFSSRNLSTDVIVARRSAVLVKGHKITFHTRDCFVYIHLK